MAAIETEDDPRWLREGLATAAVTATGPLDVDDLRNRARRIHRRRQVAGVVAAAALLLPLTTAAIVLVRPPASVELAVGDSATAGPGTPTPEMEGRRLRRAALPGDPIHPGIEMSVELERTTVRQGDQWYGVLTVRNASLERVELGPWECWEVWGLFQGSRFRGGQAGLGCLEEPVAEEWWLEPGESASWEVPFDTLFESLDGVRYEENLLPPGTYQATIGLRVESRFHDHDGTWYAPPVSVRVLAG